MQDMLGSAYPAFVRSYEKQKVQALRVNTLKASAEEFLENAPFFDKASVRRVPWEHTGAERDDTRILFGGKARRENFGFVCGARRKDDADCFVYEERGAFGVQ